MSGKVGQYGKVKISFLIDHFIDILNEGQETKLDIQRKKATATLLLKMELQSKTYRLLNLHALTEITVNGETLPKTSKTEYAKNRASPMI